MPVIDENAIPLLRAFAQLEFRLKQDPGFLGTDRHHRAKVDWPAVDAAVALLPTPLFLDLVSCSTRNKILSPPRNRPMVQRVRAENHRNVVVFECRELPTSDGRALVEAARRVRNNLFHGGKEMEHLGDDDAWAIAALDVVQRMLDLLDQGALHSPAG